MKSRNAIPAGAILSWLVSSPAAASFIGLTVEDIADNDDGLSEFAVFAQFSSDDDVLIGVVSSNISVTTSFFHSTVNGTASALPWTEAQNAQSSNPDADSFVTIGLWTGDGNTTTLAPTFDVNGFLFGSSLGQNAAWYYNPQTGQGVPDERGRVLIGVFTPNNDDFGAPGIVSGTMKIGWHIKGDLLPQFAVVSFTTLPAPAGMLVLIFACIPQRRRRF